MTWETYSLRWESIKRHRYRSLLRSPNLSLGWSRKRNPRRRSLLRQASHSKCKSLLSLKLLRKKNSHQRNNLPPRRSKSRQILYCLRPNQSHKWPIKVLLRRKLNNRHKSSLWIIYWNLKSGLRTPCSNLRRAKKQKTLLPPTKETPLQVCLQVPTPTPKRRLRRVNQLSPVKAVTKGRL